MTARNVCAYTLVSNILQNENISTTMALNSARTFVTQKDMDTELFPMNGKVTNRYRNYSKLVLSI
jgi:hypothetical protein